MQVLDLFAGLGGWSIGFYREGFECHGVDVVDVGYPYELTISDIKDFHPNQEYDVVVSSPPCTEFSQLTILSWKKGQRGPPDPAKGLELVQEGMRVIKEANPKYWLLENVWGSMKHIVPLLDLPKVTAKPWVLWGNFPQPDLMKRIPKITQKSLGVHKSRKTTLGKGGNKIGLPEDFPFDPLRSWKRARIPVFLSLRIAQACKRELLSKSKTKRGIIMGGKQHTQASIPQSIQEHKRKEVKRYKRFCSVCRKVTYDWGCCGQRTRRLNLQTTIGSQILSSENSKETK